MTNRVTSRLWPQLWDLAFTSNTMRPMRPSQLGHASSYQDIARRAFAQGRSHAATASWRFRTLSPKQSHNGVRRSFVSGGLLMLGVNESLPATTAISSCTTALEKSICTAKRGHSGVLSPFASQIWSHAMHTSSRRQRAIARRNKSSSTQESSKTSGQKRDDANTEASKTPTLKTDENVGTPESTNYFHLPHLPKMPHRPTKEELLAAATGFWSRLRVRFKWLTIRSVRPWNVDDWSAFVSWFLLGHIVWILVGTTTFFSLVVLTINTVVAQETLARWVGDYLTHSAGVKVVFESAIVPKWKDGVITFSNVFVSRRPGQSKTKVSKGSSMSAAAQAAAERAAAAERKDGEEEEDTNYTQFDVTIDTVNVTLSFAKWWNGRGPLRDVEVKGIRGVVDRTSVHWPKEYVDPRTYKHEHNPGDFEIDIFKMDDLLLTIHQPNEFRPFSVSIFSCELPQLRKQWLFYDFMSANHMTGSFDGSLFNIHPHQSHSITGIHARDHGESIGDPKAWKKHSRLRIDGLKIDHLNRGVEGPFGWIHEGNVDIVADIMFPANNDESITQVLSDLYDRMEATVTSNRYMHILENHPRTKGLDSPAEMAAYQERQQRDEDKRFLVMDLKVHLNNVRAAVPLFTNDMSYINQALIRPIVAYINNKKTFIPINCRLVKRAREFDGSWTIFDSGLMEDLSAETYDAFARDVVDNQARLRRLKKVGIWSIGLAVHALFMGMAGNVA